MHQTTGYLSYNSETAGCCFQYFQPRIPWYINWYPQGLPEFWWTIQKIFRKSVTELQVEIGALASVSNPKASGSLFGQKRTHSAGWISGILHFSLKIQESLQFLKSSLYVSFRPQTQWRRFMQWKEKRKQLSRSIDVDVLIHMNVLKWLILESLTYYPWK